MDQIRTGGWEADDLSSSTADPGWGAAEDEEAVRPDDVISSEEASGQPPKTENLGTVDVAFDEYRIETKGEEASSAEPVPPAGLSVPEGIIEEEVEEEAVPILEQAAETVASATVSRGVDLREEKLVGALSQLLQGSNEIEAAALISLDGLMIASALPNSVEEDRVAAMSAAILSLGERAASELGRGDLSQVFLEGDIGYVFMMSTGGKAVLTALAKKTAKLGLIFYDMKNVAKAIGEIL